MKFTLVPLLVLSTLGASLLGAQEACRQAVPLLEGASLARECAATGRWLFVSDFQADLVSPGSSIQSGSSVIRAGRIDVFQFSPDTGGWEFHQTLWHESPTLGMSFGLDMWAHDDELFVLSSRLDGLVQFRFEPDSNGWV